MVKTRTNLGLKTAVPVKRERALKNSSFLITINPNASFHDLESERAKDMIRRLQTLGDYFLSKKNIVKFLDFIDKDGTPPKTREEHLSLIEDIGKDRTASVERNTVYQLHLHIYVSFQHRTFIKFSRDKILLAASKLTKIPPNQMHMNISVQGQQFKQYVEKNVE